MLYAKGVDHVVPAVDALHLVHEDVGAALVAHARGEIAVEVVVRPYAKPAHLEVHGHEGATRNAL